MGRPPSLSALGKALAVLEAVLAHERLADIARATGLAPSTVHRILGELCDDGWVHTTQKCYQPGRRLMALGSHLRDDTEIRRQALPALERLRRATGMTVHLGVLKQDEIMYAEKLDGLGSYRMTSRVGAFVPLHSTAIGKAVLSTMPDAQIAATLERTGMRRVTRATRTTLGQMAADIRSTRKRGWSLDQGENEESLNCVGAPILDGMSRCVGALSVSAIAPELPAERLADTARHVVAAATLISESLGLEIGAPNEFPLPKRNGAEP